MSKTLHDLKRCIGSHGITVDAALNMLQDCRAISDNVVRLEDIANADIDRAIKMLDSVMATR